jgi:hypothetical protein
MKQKNLPQLIDAEIALSRKLKRAFQTNTDSIPEKYYNILNKHEKREWDYQKEKRKY